jgi:hypothetical protein
MTMTATDKVPKGSSNNDRMRTVHIDTSLQIERFKARRKAQTVEDGLRLFGFKSSSSYARLEFKRAWLQRLLYLYSAAQDVSRLDELIGYINDRLGSYSGHRRRLTTCLQAIESFLSRIDDDLSPTAQLIRLRYHIRNALLGAYAFWDASIVHEYDGTGCVRAAEHPKQLAGEKIDVSIPRCKRSNIQCTIHEFFEKNRDHFVAIRVGIEKLGDQASQELKDAKGIIEEAEKNSEYLCDSRNCPKLGDSLIAVDGLSMDCFAANNDKEWRFLANVLGKKLVNPLRDAKTDV